MILEAKNDKSKLFEFGQSLIEGSLNFPQNQIVGIDFLERSIEGGNSESIFYFCNLLIKGKSIPRNIQKARELIEKHFKNEKSIYLLYCGKIKKKENNFNEEKSFFEQSMNEGNADAMYEYGKLLFKGKGIDMNKEEAIKYYQKVADKSLPAMFKYGLFLMKGENVPKNEKVYFILKI